MDYPNQTNAYSQREHLKIRKVFAAVIVLVCITLASCGGSKNKEEDNLPFYGVWQKPGAKFGLSIDHNLVAYIDPGLSDKGNEKDGFPFISKYTAEETPNRLSFTYNDNYPGTVEYNPSKRTVTLTIRGIMQDGSDYTLTFNPEDRFDLVTPNRAIESCLIRSIEDKSVIDTLYRGEGVRWIDDTLRIRRVLLPDGRRGMIESNAVYATRSIPSDEAYRRNYSSSKFDQYTDTYSFERNGNQVGIVYNHLPMDGSSAYERYYLGEIDGHKIKVNKYFADPSDCIDGKFSAATPLDDPFIIYVIDKEDEPYVVANGVVYKERQY